MTVQDFMRDFAGRELGYEPITHRQTMTAGDEAIAIGVSATEVAKTVVLSTATGRVRAVLSACDRLDLHKVRDLLGDGTSIRLASEEELEEAYPMFELGAPSRRSAVRPANGRSSTEGFPIRRRS